MLDPPRLVFDTKICVAEAIDHAAERIEPVAHHLPNLKSRRTDRRHHRLSQTKVVFLPIRAKPGTTVNALNRARTSAG